MTVFGSELFGQFCVSDSPAASGTPARPASWECPCIDLVGEHAQWRNLVLEVFARFCGSTTLRVCCVCGCGFSSVDL